MARSYGGGHNEEVYGTGIAPFRKDVFVTTKSDRRTRREAEAELDISLKTMKTDYVDLWQMHMVNSKEIVEQALAPGGALEAFVAAKKAGKARFIGFTGHADPAVIVQMLRSTDSFETLLMPLHAADTAYLSFEKGALPASVERGVGQLGMKIFANAFNLRVFSVQDCLSYTLSLPVTAVTLGVTTQGQLEDDVRIVQNFKPLSNEQMDALRARAVAQKQDVTNGPALEYWKKKA
jgi:aryl-alcohol dehydrogenase-like predicted oxidoreductase